jgi:biotin-(acetyl-CoA carboxylase) ligase
VRPHVAADRDGFAFQERNKGPPDLEHDRLIHRIADDAAAIDRPATSIHIATGAIYSVDDVLARLLPLLTARLGQWRVRGFPSIRSDWQAAAVWLNQAVALQTDSGPMSGILRGYGESGELLLEVNGKVCEVWSAELMRVS